MANNEAKSQGANQGGTIDRFAIAVISKLQEIATRSEQAQPKNKKQE